MALLKYKQIGEIDPEFYRKLAQAESGGKSIKNPQKGASAAGIYQFTEGTWKNVVNKMGLNYTLNDRYDPQKQQVVIEQFTKDNERALYNTLGRKPNNTELYTAHFLGSGGANQFLTQLKNNPNAKSTPSESVLKYNKGVFLDKSGRLRTNQEVYNELTRRIEGGKKTSETFYSSPDLSYLYEVTPKITNFDTPNQSGIFAEEEKEKTVESPKIDAKQAEAERILAQKTAELNFIDEVTAQNEQMIRQSFNQQPQQQSRPVQISPLEQTFAGVSQFVDNPLLQQGGSIYDLQMNNPNPLTPEQFTIDYINSPKYRERLLKSGYKNPDEIIKNRIEQLKNTNVINQNYELSGFDKIWANIKGTPYSNSGSMYIPEKNTVVMNSYIDQKRGGVNKQDSDYVKAHELAHAETNGYPLNERDKSQLFNRLFMLIPDSEGMNKEESDNLKRESKKTDYSDVGHDSNPNENKSDLNALRYQLKKEGIYDAGKQEFKLEYLEKLKPSYFKDRLLRNYKKEDIVWLMNNIADNSEINNNIYGQQGGNIPVSSDGVFFSKGNPVIVPAPNISMKGVNYPIQATSLETGETRLLMPGEEYFFHNTKNVFEIKI